jgi:hypothetical protein
LPYDVSFRDKTDISMMTGFFYAGPAIGVEQAG